MERKRPGRFYHIEVAMQLTIIGGIYMPFWMDDEEDFGSDETDDEETEDE